jgi:hypothetical protein
MYLHTVNMPSRHAEEQLYFYFFVNLGKNANGRGLVLGYVASV